MYVFFRKWSYVIIYSFCEVKVAESALSSLFYLDLPLGCTLEVEIGPEVAHCSRKLHSVQLL